MREIRRREIAKSRESVRIWTGAQCRRKIE